MKVRIIIKANTSTSIEVANLTSPITIGIGPINITPPALTFTLSLLFTIRPLIIKSKPIIIKMIAINAIITLYHLKLSIISNIIINKIIPKTPASKVISCELPNMIGKGPITIKPPYLTSLTPSIIVIGSKVRPITTKTIPIKIHIILISEIMLKVSL